MAIGLDCNGTIDFDGIVVRANSGDAFGNSADICVAKLDDSGRIYWARTYGTSSMQTVVDMNTKSNDELVISGLITGAFVLGDIYENTLKNGYLLVLGL